MRIINHIVVLLAVVALLFSCSSSNNVVSKNFIQKRKYNKGFHVNIKRKKSKLPKKNKRVLEPSIELAKKEFSKEKLQVLSFEDNQDDNVFEPALIIPTTKDFVSLQKAKKLTNEQLHLTFKQRTVTPPLSAIKIEKQLREAQKSEAATTINLGKESAPNSVSNISSGNGKSQLVALILVYFVGVMGAHRFYLGYTGIALIQLFTLGGCLIWTIIDLVMIITGDLKPKGSEYTETL